MSEAPEIVGTTGSAPETPVSEPAAVATPASAGNWYDSLPADVRDNPAISRHSDMASLAKEHINVQKVIGSEKIPKPKEDWTPEQWAEHHTLMGRPMEPANYDLESVVRPEGMPLQDGLEDAMINVMHEEGASQKMVQRVLSEFYKLQGAGFDNANMERDRSVDNGVQGLKNEWGTSYAAQVDLANRAFRSGAGENFEEVAAIQMADGSTIGNNPAFIRVFAALGGKMSEAGLVGANARRTTFSPQEAGAEINKLYADKDFMDAYDNKSHPEHAAALKKMDDLSFAEAGEQKSG